MKASGIGDLFHSAQEPVCIISVVRASKAVDSLVPYRQMRNSAKSVNNCCC